MKLFSAAFVLVSVLSPVAAIESIKVSEIVVSGQVGDSSYFKLKSGKLLLARNGQFGPSKDGGEVEFTGATATANTDGQVVIFETTWKDATGKTHVVKTNCNGWTLEKCVELHWNAVTLLQAKYPPVASTRHERTGYNIYELPRLSLKLVA